MRVPLPTGRHEIDLTIEQVEKLHHETGVLLQEHDRENAPGRCFRCGSLNIEPTDPVTPRGFRCINCDLSLTLETWRRGQELHDACIDAHWILSTMHEGFTNENDDLGTAIEYLEAVIRKGENK